MKKHSYIRAALGVAIVGVSALVANIAQAAAPEPVALWSGEMADGSKSGPWTMSLNGNKADRDGNVNVTGNKGLLLSKDVDETWSQEVTVIVEYSNYTASAYDAMIDFGGNKDNKSTIGSNCDYIGACANTSGNGYMGVWANNKYDDGGIDTSVNPANNVNGRMALIYKYSGFSIDSTVYNTALIVNGNVAYKKNGLKGEKIFCGYIGIGGKYYATSGDPTPSDGMRIEKIAIFDAPLTVDEVVSYKFPEPSKRTDQVININVFQDGTAIAQPQTTLASDSVQIPANGWITVGQPSYGTATASSTTAYSLLNESTVTLEEPINITAYSVQGSNWAYWNKGDTPSPIDSACAYMTCWASNRDRSCIPGSFKVENIPYDNYEVILYFQGGTEQVTGDYGTPTVEGQTPTGFDPIRVTSGNSKYIPQHYYKPDETGTLSVDTGLSALEEVKASDVITLSSMWGSRRQASAAYGVNAVRIENCTGTFEIHYWARTSGIAAMQIIDRSSSRIEATLREDMTWSQLWAGRKEPGEGALVQINVEGSPKLTLDKLPECDVIYFKGEGDVVIASSSKAMLVDAIPLFKGVQLSGSIVLEFNVKSGYEATEELRNAIKTAGNKLRFVFRGVGESGVKLDYGDGVDFNTTIGTHLVFDGGTHTVQMVNESGGMKFGANATADNPTFRVTNGATLNFKNRNPCGWSTGQSNANGIIRVDDGSILNWIPTVHTVRTKATSYWAQQIYLEPGATLAIDDNGANFRVNGGTDSGATSQFYVPDSAEDMTDKPAIIKQLGTGGVYVNGEGTANMAVYVGKNSKLFLDCKVERCTQSAGNQVTKYGAGILEAKDGTISNIPTWQLNGGTLAYNGSLATVNLNSATLFGNGEKITITGTLHTAGSSPSTVKDVVFNGTAFQFGTGNSTLIADGFEYSPSETIPSTSNGTIKVNDLTINYSDGLPGGVGLDVREDGILRLISTAWETPRKLCGGTLQAPSGKVKRTIYLGDKAYKTKVLFDTSAKTIDVFKPGLLFFVQ